MTHRMIAMNIHTCEISFAELTAQEIAELQAITDDYRRRFDPPHPPSKPTQRGQNIDNPNAGEKRAQVAM